MDGFKKFIGDYWGAILGGIIALIIACTSMYRLVIGIVLVCIGIWVGNYFQHNKDKVKTKIKSFIDKI